MQIDQSPQEGATPAPTEEIEAAALQFVRKISGFSRPATHNEDVFNQAVHEISEASMRLLDGLEIRGAKALGLVHREAVRPTGTRLGDITGPRGRIRPPALQ